MGPVYGQKVNKRFTDGVHPLLLSGVECGSDGPDQIIFSLTVQAEDGLL
jgi:hypothetical protein